MIDKVSTSVYNKTVHFFGETNMAYTYQIRRILSYTRRAVDDFHMIEEGDRIAVGLSGGKDSLALLCSLASLRGFYPKHFELEAVTMDPGFYKAGMGSEAETREGFAHLAALCEQLGVHFTLFETELAKLIFDERKESNPWFAMRPYAPRNAARPCQGVRLQQNRARTPF